MRTGARRSPARLAALPAARATAAGYRAANPVLWKRCRRRSSAECGCCRDRAVGAETLAVDEDIRATYAAALGGRPLESTVPARLRVQPAGLRASPRLMGECDRIPHRAAQRRDPGHRHSRATRDNRLGLPVGFGAGLFGTSSPSLPSSSCSARPSRWPASPPRSTVSIFRPIRCRCRKRDAARPKSGP